MEEAIASGTGGMTHLAPGGHKQFHLCASGGLHAIEMVSEPLCPGGDTRRPGPRWQNAAAFI